MAPAEREFRRYDDYSGSPPPAPRESLLPYFAFLLAVAVLSGGAGYVLNRVIGSSGGTRSEAAPTPVVSGSAVPTSPPGSTTVTAPGAVNGLTGLTAEQVAIRLSGAGLPLRTTTVYTAATDPEGLLGQPNAYTSKIAFTDPRIGRDEIFGTPADAIERGGRIEVFPDAANAKARATKVTTVTTDNPLITEYTYVQHNVVLRLSLVLPEDMARQYESALVSLGA
jgi:hypothetical protein